jgi:hypothetical protein
LENLQKTSKKTPALVWLFAYKSKIAKKKKYFDIEVKTTISSKKNTPQNFCRLCKKKKLNVRPPYKTNKNWTNIKPKTKNIYLSSALSI